MDQREGEGGGEMKRVVKKLTDIKVEDKQEKDFSETFWKDKSSEEALPQRKGRCHDCAITYDFYTPIADELKKEEHDVQVKVCNGWFCHTTPNKMCKGVVEYLGLEKEYEEETR